MARVTAEEIVEFRTMFSSNPGEAIRQFRARHPSAQLPLKGINVTPTSIWASKISDRKEPYEVKERRWLREVRLLRLLLSGVNMEGCTIGGRYNGPRSDKEVWAEGPHRITFEECRFTRASLQHSTFQNVDFRMINFRSCCLVRARFTRCYFNLCDFKKADLRYSSFEYCTFGNVKFEDTNFRHATIENSVGLYGGKFIKADGLESAWLPIGLYGDAYARGYRPKNA